MPVPKNQWARSVEDVFGWSRPFRVGLLPAGLFDLMDAAGALHEHGEGWRSTVRASTLDGALFVHSAYPTFESDSVFFGRDTYRFAAEIEHQLATQAVRRVVDIGCGAGPGAVLVARAHPEAEVIAVDINDKALDYTRANAILAGANVITRRSLPLESSVPAGLDTQVLEFDSNAPRTLEDLFLDCPAEIAAVILTPEMVLPPRSEVFEAIQDLTRRHGAVFILDEVKTAFRTAPGSVQARLGPRPDLTTVSKGMGDGWPVAAVIGRREVMSSAAGMHLSATYHGDTASMAAALTTLRIVEERDVAAHVWALGQRLIDGLNESFVSWTCRQWRTASRFRRCPS